MERKAESAVVDEPVAKKKKKKCRQLCSLGTGECIHVLHFKCADGKKHEFEVAVQRCAHSMYQLQTGLSDVRILHPVCGEICFILTFLTRKDMDKFRSGPERDLLRCLKPVTHGAAPTFQTCGTLMPAAHSLDSLVTFLKENVKGRSFSDHCAETVGREMAKWFPRPEEYQKYIHWDNANPSKYTRNVVFANEHMDVLFMCWPPGSVSPIHDHSESSCWVALVGGCVHEVQYAMPKFDRKFIEGEMKNPTGAVGRCGKLRVTGVSEMSERGITSTYANNDIGLHRVENRSDEPAYTLHVYAPGLRKMRLFAESGEVGIYTVAAPPMRP